MNHIDPKAAFSLQALAAADIAVRRPEHVELSAAAREIAEDLSERPISATLLAGFTRLFETIAIAAIGMIVYGVYVLPLEGVDLAYAPHLVGGAILALVLNQAAGAYEVSALRTHVSQLGRIFAAWTMVFAFFALVMFFTKSGHSFSRVWFGSWYLGGLAFYVVWRPTLAAFVRRWTREGRIERRAIIVGGGKNAEELIRALEAQPMNDIRICGIFDDRGDDRSPPIVAGYPKLGSIAELVEFCRVARIDMLIVSLPIAAEMRLLSVLKQLWVLPVDIRLSAHSNKLRFRPRAYSYVGTVPFLDVFEKPLADWNYVAKRTFDIVFSALLIVLLSPIMIGAAIAVRLDSPGRVVFRQKRYGFNNEVIEVFKFRSMYEGLGDASGTKQTTKGDARVTRVGRFIRKTSIDELPQLFNVLIGDLSLVGPRPHPLHAHTQNKLWDEVVDGYFARHRVKPGVTGWAQINGWRGEADTPEKIRRRVECDLYYIENWSVLLDLYIVAMTPLRLLNTENAY